MKFKNFGCYAQVNSIADRQASRTKKRPILYVLKKNLEKLLDKNVIIFQSPTGYELYSNFWQVYQLPETSREGLNLKENIF